MSQPSARSAARSARVDLLPGRSTRSVIAGSGWPGSSTQQGHLGVGRQRVQIVEIGQPRQMRHARR